MLESKFVVEVILGQAMSSGSTALVELSSSETEAIHGVAIREVLGNLRHLPQRNQDIAEMILECL